MSSTSINNNGQASYGALDGGDDETERHLLAQHEPALGGDNPPVHHREHTPSHEHHSHKHGHAWWGASGLCRRPQLLIDWLDADKRGPGVRSGEDEERHISWSEVSGEPSGHVHHQRANCHCWLCGRPVVL